MDFIKGFNRDQLVMMDFESAVAHGSWARIVDMFVDILPMAELGFSAVLNTEGRPLYRSSDMLKLYLYGYWKMRRISPIFLWQRGVGEWCSWNRSSSD